MFQFDPFSSIKSLKSRAPILQLVVASCIGVLLGSLSVLSSPMFALAALLAVVAAFVALTRPEIALIGILIATSSVVYEDTLPLLPIGFGSLHVSDVVLLALLGLILVRWLAEPDFKFIRTPLDLLLLAFLAVSLLSTLISITGSSVDPVLARREFRLVAYYLTFFIATNLLRENRQLRTLLAGILLLATVVAVAMVAQSLLGGSLKLLPGRVETLTTQGRVFSGVFRILPPGQSLVLLGFITVTAILVVGENRVASLFRLIQWGVFGVVVVMTFNRTFWGGAIVALVLLAYLVKSEDRLRLVIGGSSVVVVAFIILVPNLGQPNSRLGEFARASFDRLRTITTPAVFTDGSLQWRNVENEYAVRQIVAHPVLGLGLGAHYRPLDPWLDLGQRWEARGYIHNGHLWIMTKTGVIGYLLLIGFMGVSIWRGLKYWRGVRDRLIRGAVLGFTLTLIAVLIGSITIPMFMQWFWIPVIGIMAGFNEVALSGALPRSSRMTRQSNAS